MEEGISHPLSYWQIGTMVLSSNCSGIVTCDSLGSRLLNGMRFNTSSPGSVAFTFFPQDQMCSK